MNTKRRIPIFCRLSLLCFLSLFCACTPTTQEAEKTTPVAEAPAAPVSITIEAEQFVDAKGAIEKEGGIITTTEEESWLAFNVEVPVAGRYKFEILASSESESASAWMEDYTNNKDERTYNVTGEVKIKSGEKLMTSSRDGSPLNAGAHPMKLHLKGAKTKVDWIQFTLMKKHQLTPQTLTQKTDGKEWVVAWADEFEGEGLPDTSKWTFDIGDWGWGNNELQYYTENRLENARQENGHLIIEARKNDVGNLWTSARLTTRGKVTFRYGRIEFRAKVPPNRGNWAAGWTLGDQYVDELSWPYCGEIDILESVGFEMDDATGNGKAHASVHCEAYYFKLGNQFTGNMEMKNMHEAFHVYAVDWTPEGIIASVDGKEYFSYKDDGVAGAWPFDEAQNIILNLAMGGGWGGLKGMDESMSTQQFIVDYVRVYEKR